MARAVAKSRQLVSLACTNYHAVGEALCKNLPAYKHTSLDAFKRFNEAVTKSWRELSQHYSWTNKQAFLDHGHHTAGVKPSAAKPAAQRLPRFELSKVDVDGALLAPAKKLHVKAGFAPSLVRVHRYFSVTESTSWLREAKTIASGGHFQIVRHIKPGGVASWRRLYHSGTYIDKTGRIRQNRRHRGKRGNQHFKAPGPVPQAPLQRPEGGYLELLDRRVVFAIILAGGWAYIYSTHLEFVPYTHRRHFVLLSPKMERVMGDIQFQLVITRCAIRLPVVFISFLIKQRDRVETRLNSIRSGLGCVSVTNGMLTHHQSYIDWILHVQLKRQWAEHLPPPSHPATVKVERVAKDIIAAVLTAEGDRWGTPGKTEGQRGYLDHLKGMQWEIIVVDRNELNACCLPGGKIVVFTGLLKHFKTDEEIATVLGHEVAHAVARHGAENLSRAVWLVILCLAAQTYLEADINHFAKLLIVLPFSRRMETEADHLGLVLMAAAGFNPVLAPSVYDKLGQFDENSAYLSEYMSTHPPSKKRAKSLRDGETMKRAMLIYREKLYGGLDIRQFL